MASPSPGFRGNRPVIAILGRCNTGKSSLLNFIAGQPVAMVSSTPGTTADPLSKPFELLPLGPVTFYDTAGLDEDSPLGRLRGQASLSTMLKADMALLLTDEEGIGPLERSCAQSLQESHTPFILLFNKSDIRPASAQDLAWCAQQGIACMQISLEREKDPTPLRQALLELAPARLWRPPPLLADLVPENPLVVCVAPIDAGAPAGRLIAPQVQTLREIIEIGGQALLLQPGQLKQGLNRLRARPHLVITDSQAVRQVNRDLPADILLTTFSMLFARQKADFGLMLEGARQIKNLAEGARVLIAEACSHHAQKDDIGRAKLPAWLQACTGRALNFSFYAGTGFPENLAEYSLALHCGGCMLTYKEMQNRLHSCRNAGVPVTNYGMAIAQCQGLLARVSRIFEQRQPQLPAPGLPAAFFPE